MFYVRYSIFLTGLMLASCHPSLLKPQSQSLLTNSEARIILPVKGNDDHPLKAQHTLLKTQLSKHFGGYTAFQGEGGWLAPDQRLYQESVMIYDISMQDTLENCHTLHNIAKHIGSIAKQETMYVRCANDTVAIIATTP